MPYKPVHARLSLTTTPFPPQFLSRYTSLTCSQPLRKSHSFANYDLRESLYQPTCYLIQLIQTFISVPTRAATASTRLPPVVLTGKTFLSASPQLAVSVQHTFCKIATLSFATHEPPTSECLATLFVFQNNQTDAIKKNLESLAAVSPAPAHYLRYRVRGLLAHTGITSHAHIIEIQQALSCVAPHRSSRLEPFFTGPDSVTIIFLFLLPTGEYWPFLLYYLQSLPVWTYEIPTGLVQ